MSRLAPPQPAPRRVKGYALALSGAAMAVVLALVYAEPVPKRGAQIGGLPVQEIWTGSLDGAATDGEPSTGPLTSASLVVPKSQLALPAKTKTFTPRAVTAKPCVSPACQPTTTVARVATPPASYAMVEPVPQTEPASGLMARLNPLNHVPVSVRSTLAGAEDTMTGWFKRF